MNYLQLQYQTWQRQESYGMFDYSESNQITKNQKIMIKQVGSLERNQNDHKIIFVPKHQKTKNQLYKPICQILYIQDRFYLQNISSSQSLCQIVSKSIKRQIKQGQTIKIGKTSLQILKISWKIKKNNHYQNAQNIKLPQKQSVFAGSFYSQQSKASFVDTNPSCRYCFTQTISEQDPFLVLCNCAGNAKYIHKSCVSEWIKKRNQSIISYPKKGVYCALGKALICEVCKQYFRLDRLIQQIFNVNNDILNEVVILKVNTEDPLIYIIDLNQSRQIHVGRSLQCEVVVNQLSVSRKHCQILINRQNMNISILDLSSKFGTTIQITRSQIKNNKQYQRGRTKLKFKRRSKMNFLQKLGFCSNFQNYKNNN